MASGRFDRGDGGDGPQAVLPNNFVKLMEQIKQIAENVGHRVTPWGRDAVAPRRTVVGGWAM